MVQKEAEIKANHYDLLDRVIGDGWLEYRANNTDTTLDEFRDLYLDLDSLQAQLKKQSIEDLDTAAMWLPQHWREVLDHYENDNYMNACLDKAEAAVIGSTLLTQSSEVFGELMRWYFERLPQKDAEQSMKDLNDYIAEYRGVEATTGLER